jgi:hypothetical protein
VAELRLEATVDGLGRLRFDPPEIAAAELSRLAGKKVTVIVKRAVNTRSIAQNRLLWASYGEAVAEGVDFVELETGQPVFQSRDDVHGFAKLALLRRPVMTNRGEIDLLGTTTKLTTAEFSKYMDLLVAKLAKYGVYVPPPGTSR